MMTVKPSYEELELKLQDIEKEFVICKQMQATLNESEKFSNSLLENSPTPIIVVNPDTSVKYINHAMEKLTGFSFEELNGIKAPYPWWTDETIKKTADDFQEFFTKGAEGLEELFKKKNGKRFWVEITAIPVLESGQFKHVISSWVDITKRKLAENALQKSELQWRTILNASIDRIRQVDKNMRILWANEATAKGLDMSVESIIGQTCYKLFVDSDIPCEGCPMVKTLETGQIEKKIMYKQQSRGITDESFWDIYCVPLKNESGDIESFIQVSRNVTDQKRSEEYVKSLSQQLLSAQERERQMISYELHDRIAQNLSALKIGCDTLFDGQSMISQELTEKIAKLSELAEMTITSVRDLSYDLRPPHLEDIDIVKLLEIYCEEFYENSGIRVEFQSAGMQGLSPNSECKIHLYRLVQEGLINIRKHADAHKATVKLVGTFPNIYLRIEDDGKGFDVKMREQSLDSEKRMGLRSMKERVNLLGGQMEIYSLPMKGTKIFIKFPIKD